MVKFGLSEKHTKFEKIFLMVLTNQLIYLVNIKTMRILFFKLSVFLKKSELWKKYYLFDFIDSVHDTGLQISGSRLWLVQCHLHRVYLGQRWVVELSRLICVKVHWAKVQENFAFGGGGGGGNKLVTNLKVCRTWQYGA